MPPAGEPFKGHDGWVSSVAFAPTGDKIASVGLDGTVRLWQLDGRPMSEPFHVGGVLIVAFAPTGDRIVSGGVDGTVRLWRLDGTAAAGPFKGHDGWVSSVAFAPTGDRIVSGGKDGTVRLWQLDGHPAGEPFKAHEGGVWGVAFSPAGDRIISAGEDGAVRFSRLDGTPLGEPIVAAGRPNQIGVMGSRTIWVRSTNRVWFSDLEGRGRGQFRFGIGGSVAITPEGVLAPTGTLLGNVIAVDVENKHIDQPRAVAQIDAATRLGYPARGAAVVEGGLRQRDGRLVTRKRLV